MMVGSVFWSKELAHAKIQKELGLSPSLPPYLALMATDQDLALRVPLEGRSDPGELTLTPPCP